jgi:hypothetical protein
MKIPKHLTNTVIDYSKGLDDYFGKHAHQALIDDEDPAVERVLKRLNADDRNQAVWIVGWFRGVADFLSCKPVEIYDAISHAKPSSPLPRKKRAA